MRALCAMLAAVAAVLAFVPGALADTVDQQQTASDTDNNLVTTPIGQSFTAGLTGSLTQIEVKVDCLYVPSTDLTLSVYSGAQTTSSPLPPALYSESFDTPSSIPSCITWAGEPATWVTIDLPTDDVFVTAGSTYTFVVSGFAERRVPEQDGDAYSGGAEYGAAAGFDLVFRTHVDTSVTTAPVGGVDQQDISTSDASISSTTGGFFGETFQAGQTGALTRILVDVQCVSAPASPTLTIYDGSPSPFLPRPAPLYSGSISLPLPPCPSSVGTALPNQWVSLPIPDGALSVTAGHTYTFVLGGFGVIQSEFATDPYPNGSVWGIAGQSWAFETWVDFTQQQGVVDQQQPATGQTRIFSTLGRFGQTFTAGKTGPLTGIAFQASCVVAFQPLQLFLYNGTPDPRFPFLPTPAYAEPVAVVLPDCFSQRPVRWVAVSIPDGAFDVKAGQTYTFLISGSDEFGAPSDGTNSYSGGDEFGGTAGADLAFETWVDAPPAPPIAVTGVDVSGTEGSAFGGTVATFTAPGAAGDYRASIDWGDGSVSTGTISAGSGNFVVSGTHTYTEDGAYTVTTTVQLAADSSDTAQATSKAAIADAAPVVTISGPSNVGESQIPVVYTYQATDPAGGDDVLSVSVGCGSSGSLVGGSTTATSFACVFADGPASSHVFVSATDPDGPTTEQGIDVTVANVPPSITSFTTTASAPIAVGSTMSVTTAFADPGTLDTHTVTYDWGDGTRQTVAVGGAGDGSATASHRYSGAGVYTVAATVTDRDGGTETAALSTPVIVYDPTTFVTGGGWIASSGGNGKANFGFNARYLPGQARPSGSVEFHAAGADFHAATLDWLVVAGGTVELHGTGTVAGAGAYVFLLTATSSGLRIEISDAATGAVVYDQGSVEPLGGGSIVIHH